MTARICLSPGTLNPGGIGRVMVNLAEEFVDRGIAVDFFLSQAVGPYLNVVPREARVIAGAGTVKSSIPSFVRYLHREKPAAVISAHQHVNVMNVLAAKTSFSKSRIIVTVHVVTSTNNQAVRSRFTALMDYLARRVYPRADSIVAVSQAVADDSVRHIHLPPDRVSVIYNPVVTSSVFEMAREEPRHPWFKESDAPVILCLARLAEQKDLPTLLRAFTRVLRNRRAKLVILGEGPLRDVLEALVRTLHLEGSVALPGYEPNPFACIARARMVVLSSAWEGLPTSLIESLALGTPVVSTDCPGGSREILADGKYGRLVPVGDVDGLANAMLATLDEPPDRALLRARGNDFAASRAAQRYLDLTGL